MESIMVLAMVVLGRHGQYLRRDSGRRAVDNHPLNCCATSIGPLFNESLGRMIVDPENARMLMFGLALIVVMLVRPEGLWPSAPQGRIPRCAGRRHSCRRPQAADGLKG